MKRFFFMIWAISVIFPIAVEIYAQPIQEANIAYAPALTSSVNPEFLKSINAQEKVDSYPWAGKLESGVINTTTSWTDIPREMANVSEEENLVSGCTLGFGKGVVYGLGRGIAGVIDMATFSVAPTEKPLMEPEYKVKHPNEEGFKINLLEW